ncbi:hypothetical protein BO71DRAFT_487919 [Aspergillus ellipticus CBS 707.79]|uniref:Uncharacterized protein n=1 Tax=Aspergillus ellipticus CBS 707.79 TaxID=1448320 RepID=A0A319CY08_9EURO|nr:hypothetical protein BO71DRAFT_487919 [Aspergillus ellipticus CBS 707.79]
MACSADPKQILKRELSLREYEHLEEWAPEMLKNYTLPKSILQKRALTQHNTVVSPPQDQSPRRSKARKSSLFEEWKSQASESNDTNGVAITPVSKENTIDKAVSPAAEVKATGRQSGDPSAGASSKLQSQDSASSKASNTHYAKPTVAASNRSNIIPAAKVAPKATEQGNKRKAPETQPRQHAEIPVYVAPTGVRFRRDELIKWSNGIKNRKNDLVYFRPSFIEDPWKNMKPVLTTFLERYYQQFDEKDFIMKAACNDCLVNVSFILCGSFSDVLRLSLKGDANYWAHKFYTDGK